MNKAQLFSRLPDAAVDFRPDVAEGSPHVQLRRLNAYLKADNVLADAIEDCPEALDYLREYTYRKIFTGTSHEDFIATDKTAPYAIDWLIAVHEAETAIFQAKRGGK